MFPPGLGPGGSCFCCPRALCPGGLIFAFGHAPGLGSGFLLLVALRALGSENAGIPVDYFPVGLRKLYLDKLHPWIFLKDS